jgi:hypothetical protein
LIQIHGLDIRRIILHTPNNAHNNINHHISVSDTQNKTCSKHESKNQIEMKECSRSASPLSPLSDSSPIKKRIEDKESKRAKRNARGKKARRNTQALLTEQTNSHRTNQRQDIAHRNFCTYEYRPYTNNSLNNTESTSNRTQIAVLNHSENANDSDNQMEEYVMDENNSLSFTNNNTSTQQSNIQHPSISQHQESNQYLAQAENAALSNLT